LRNSEYFASTHARRFLKISCIRKIRKINSRRSFKEPTTTYWKFFVW